MPPVDLLLGERDPFMRRALEHILSPAYRLHFIEDGAVLIERARSLEPALIVTEALLPGLDGFQVCRELKANPKTRHIPILVFTWLLARERALQSGADAFLLKPLNPPDFLSTIHRLLQSTGKEQTV